MNQRPEKPRMSDKCPICKSGLSTPDVPFMSRKAGIHGKAYSCPRCGDYQIESFAGAQLNARLDGDKKIAVLSHWIRSRYERRNTRGSQVEEPINLTDDIVRDIIEEVPPSPAEQASKFVLWLGGSEHPPGELIPVKPATHQSIMGAVTPAGFELVLYDLMDKGLLNGMKSQTIGSYGHAKIALSIDGWQLYTQLRQGVADTRKAFMAMKYGDAQLDKAVEDTFKPAVRETGFDLFKLIERPKAGLIDDSLRVEIRTSRFLIADLTHENAGAYWEAGYAEGLGKPVIYTCEKKVFEDSKSKPHFDTNHHLTVLWEASNPENAAEELKATIRATLPAEAKLTDD